MFRSYVAEHIAAYFMLATVAPLGLRRDDVERVEREVPAKIDRPQCSMRVYSFEYAINSNDTRVLGHFGFLVSQTR